MKLSEIIKNEEVLKQLNELLGENLEKFETLLDGDNVLNMVPYSRFQEVNESKKKVEQEATNLKTKLTKLTNDKNITPDELEEKRKEIIKEYDEKIKNIQKDFDNYKRDEYVKSKLAESKCKYPDLVMGKIDLTKLAVSEDGKGYMFLDEQINGLKEKYSDMFSVEEDNAQKQNRNDGIFNSQTKSEANILAEKMGFNI